jgi:uncharacterized protein YndB with AHSA1/START domain
MAAPLLQAQIDIGAPVAKVWALISDLSRMPQWSPQCRVMKPLGPLRQGTRSYELEPTDTGTRVVESRHAENGVTAISNMAINAAMGGVPSFERELVDGMNETLSRIKAAAES